MYAPVSSTPLPFPLTVTNSAASPGTKQRSRAMQVQPATFVSLVRNHHRAIFHLTHALLRDEVAAEKITQQVFARARRRLDHGQTVAVEWIYYASLRFIRMYHWKSIGLIARRRMLVAMAAIQPELDLNTFVQVMARQPGKIDPRDCELLALRYVLGMSLGNIGQLLRMHPYEVSNRIAWGLERVGKLSRLAAMAGEKPAELALSA